MIWSFCIRRPVLTVVVFIIVAIFGLYAYTQLPVRENPDIEFPVVSVNVVLPGAEPEVIETELIEPLEERINTIEGLKRLESTAREEVAQVTAEFELWRDIDVAAQDVRDRVDRARRDLPDEIEPPIVRKLDPDAQPIMWIALTGDDRWNAVRLTRYADEQLKERLENIRGVGQILIGGERLYAVRVRLDPARLAARGVTVQDVVRTIRENNVKIPSGRVQSQQREFLVKTKGQFAGPEPLNDLVIAERDGTVVRIADVGQAVDGVENDRQLARFSQSLAVGLGVVKQTDANTVALANAVRNHMRALAEQFPAGLAYTVATDSSIYIKQSVRDLILTVFLATGLVMLVVLGFLRSFRGTLITTIAIPVSLLGGMALIYLLGFSLNVLTLLALILAIGIVIDDAVIVLESSYRDMEQGTHPDEATRSGTARVAFPNIANTLSLAAVFIPVAFTAGLIGRFFFEFSLTVAVTVFASTFAALTLTPLLCARFLRLPERPNWWYRWSEQALVSFQQAYAWTLDQSFRHRTITIALGLIALLLMVLTVRNLPQEFTPPIDRSQFLVNFETPEGSTLAHTNAYARQVERVLANTDEVKHFFVALGLSRGAGPGRVNQGIAFVRLRPRANRLQHQAEVVQELRKRLDQLPGGQAYVIEPGLGLARGAGLQVVLKHTNLTALARRQETVIQWMRKQDEYLGVNSNLKMNKPEVEVHIQRDKAGQMGISVTEIANTLRYLLGEPDISEIEQQAERYEVIPEIVGKGNMIPDRLDELYLRNKHGRLVSLGNVVKHQEGSGPSAIHHFNRLRSATISASTPPGVTLGAALRKLEKHFADTLPPEFSYAVAGRTKDFQESFYYLTIALLFSVVFVYLVLAAQFESFLHPFTILLTLPLAGVGAFGALWLLGMSFNIFSFIGLIMLVGMATKNGILLVDYANKMTREGRQPIEAAKEAARVRFRPVIMTTVSTVLGLLPIALGFGAGGESRAPLGVAVAAGLLVTTGLTLLILPVVYSLNQRLQDRISNGSANAQRE